MEIRAYETGPFLKKWYANEIAVLEHEADNQVASHFLYMSDQRSESSYAHVINVPYEEFRELVFFLPDFDELPVMWSAWNDCGRPITFIVRCIEDQDTIAVDTSGFEYARYRAAACKLEQALV